MQILVILEQMEDLIYQFCGESFYIFMHFGD